MNNKDIREMSEAEIEKQLRDARGAQGDLIVRKQVTQSERPHKFKELRRQIARLETILKEKKLAVANV